MPTTLPYLTLQLLVLIAGGVFVSALLLGARRQVQTSILAIAMLVVGCTFVFLLMRGREITTSIRSHAELVNSVPHLGLPDEGFTSSSSCQACHPHHYQTWHDSYHRTMTQPATPRTVVADLDNVRLENRGRTYFVQRRGDEYWVDMVDPDWEHELLAKSVYPNLQPDPPRVWKRIVMTTGSHHQQTYWVASKNGRKLYNLPFMYLVDDDRIVPREEVFLRPPNAGRGFDVWNNNCIECHSVAGEPNFDDATGHFDTRVAELGISCEACHGPGHEHVRANRDPRRRYRYHSASEPDPTIVHPGRLDAQRSAYVCGQCHGMNVLKNDTFRAGLRYRAGGDLTDVKMILRMHDENLTDADKPDWPRLQRHLKRQTPTFLEERFWPDGMVRVSGREHNAMVESPCFRGGELSCLSCHSMHSAMSTTDLLARDMDTNLACLQCHQSYAADITAHTHHAPESSGSQCMNCHMPHTTYGLLKAIRSHHINSPSVRESLDASRSNACNLCHLDKPLDFAARHLHEWYDQPQPELSPEHRTTSAALLWLLRGDANQRALIAWHMGWEPAKQASGQFWLAPHLAHLLSDPYSAVRYIAGRSLRQLPHLADLHDDFVGQQQYMEASRRRAVELWTRFHVPRLDRHGEHVLINADGSLQTVRINQFAAQRDDRMVDLRE